jgi:hypothetical protein
LFEVLGMKAPRSVSLEEYLEYFVFAIKHDCGCTTGCKLPAKEILNGC